MKQIIIILIVYLNCIFVLHAQNEYFVVNSPHSPEAASFTRYMELPVSLYTGTLDISIPVYNLQVDDVSIPITLSYHNSGVRVEEEAGWVGLGWNLAAGGCISRRVNDKPDDLEYGWQEDNHVLDYPTDYCGNRSEYYFPKLLNCENYTYCNCGGNLDASVNTDQLTILRNNNLYDFEPDIYSYSFEGQSGSFSFDKDGNLVKREQNNTRILKKVIDGSTVPIDIYWEITDEIGNIYEFKKKQYSWTELTVGIEYVSAWFLSRITTKNGKTIDFIYNTDENPYVVGMSMFSQSYDCLNATFDGNTPYSGQFSETVNVNSRVYLNEIVTSEGERIIFTLGGRRDLENSSRLDSIEVRNLNNEIVKKYKLGYSYIVSTPDPVSSHQASYVNSEYCSKLKLISGYSNAVVNDTAYIRNTRRLQLDYIQEISNDGIEKLNPYTFTYNSIILPVKLSFSVDHWGYFNGAANTNKLPTLIDYVTYLGKYNINHYNEFMQFFQANRQQDATNGKACMLEKITYPTLGTLTIEYEPNSFTNINKFEPYTVDINGNSVTSTIGYGGGFRVKSVINHDPVSGKSITKTFNYYNGLLVCIPNYVRYERDYHLVEDKDCFRRDPFDRIIVSSYSNASSSNALSGSHVGYSKVEEITGVSDETIKTEYNYLNEEEILCGVSKEYGPTVPSVPNLSNGLLNSKIEYNGTTAVRSTTYNYYPMNNTNNYGVRVFFNSIIQGSCEEAVGELEKEDVKLVFFKYITNWNELSSVTEITDGITTTKSYYYDNPQLYLPSRISTTLNNNIVETEKNKYPLDFSSIPTEAALNTMRNKNMVNFLIETQIWKDDKIISATFNKYEDITKPRIYKVYKLDTNQPLSSFIGLDSYGSLSISNQYSLKTTINEYDNYGNPKSITTSDGLTTQYEWGYNGKYITKKTIQGTSPSGVLSSLYETWAWKPLVGITSHIDQTGLKTTYEYDSFGRLITVKNNDNNIVKAYEYHYQGQ